MAVAVAVVVLEVCPEEAESEVGIVSPSTGIYMSEQGQRRGSQHAERAKIGCRCLTAPGHSVMSQTESRR